LFLLYFKGGGRLLRPDLRESINSHLKQNSNIGSNRLVKKKKNALFVEDTLCEDFVPVRYLIDTQKELFKTFAFRNEISYSTFYKYLKHDGVYKKAFRLTDICDYCEWAKKNEKVIRKICSDENYIVNDFFDHKDAIKFLKSKKAELNPLDEQKLNYYDQIIYKIEDFGIVSYHKWVAKNQREAYNFQRESVEFLNNKIMIVADFKQKIPIGLSPFQVSKEYYAQQLRTCLGKFTYSSY
jgi:hypothetical protein